MPAPQVCIVEVLIEGCDRVAWITLPQVFLGTHLIGMLSGWGFVVLVKAATWQVPATDPLRSVIPNTLRKAGKNRHCRTGSAPCFCFSFSFLRADSRVMPILTLSESVFWDRQV